MKLNDEFPSFRDLNVRPSSWSEKAYYGMLKWNTHGRGGEEKRG